MDVFCRLVPFTALKGRNMSAKGVALRKNDNTSYSPEGAKYFALSELETMSNRDNTGLHPVLIYFALSGLSMRYLLAICIFFFQYSIALLFFQ
jgi:hypothetical protein